MSQQKYDVLVKLVVVGDPGVGKTKFITRFVDNTFCSSYEPTMYLDFKIKTILLDGKRVKLQIWDTPRRDRFNSFGLSYYRAAMGIILMYDVTNKSSFNNVRCHFQEAEHGCSDAVPIILVRHKVDGVSVISSEMGAALAEQHQLLFTEVSAKNNHNVSEVFENIIRKAILHCHKDVSVELSTPQPTYCCIR